MSRWLVPAAVLSLCLPWAVSDDLPRRYSRAVADDPVPPMPAPLSIAVTGPREVDAGRLVTLDASSEGASIRWHLAGRSADEWQSCESGRVYFATPVPGEYVFVAVAARSVDSRCEIAIVEHAVTVRGSLPQPGPGPAPEPIPLPPGRFGLSQVAHDAAWNLPASDSGMLLSIAENYSVVASKTAAGVIKAVDAMIAETTTKNRATVGDQRERVKPILFDPLAESLAELSEAGTLDTLADHVDAWNEIALGLNAAGVR